LQGGAKKGGKKKREGDIGRGGIDHGTWGLSDHLIELGREEIFGKKKIR